MIYFDNSATTKPCKAAIDAALKASEEVFANPSSLHFAGSAAAEMLLDARNELLAAIHGSTIRAKLPRKPEMRGGEEYGRLIFTTSGTESDNLAIRGIIASTRIKNPEIITTNSEHPAVLETVRELEKSGVKAHYLKTAGGKIDLNELKSKLNSNTALVSVMHVNNETGAIYDLKEIFSTVKAISPDAVCHADCVQSFQKLLFTPKSICADLITVSAHKVHGLKGVGALWISKELAQKNRPYPIIFGGGQESGVRPGTENVPGIAAFGAAVKANGSDKAAIRFGENALKMRELLVSMLNPEVKVNECEGNTAPHIISLTLPVPKSQPMLNYLSALGICVSSGSACSSHKNTVSHVLTAFGLTNTEADSTIRVSLDDSNTESEIEEFCQALSDGIEKLGK